MYIMLCSKEQFPFMLTWEVFKKYRIEGDGVVMISFCMILSIR